MFARLELMVRLAFWLVAVPAVLAALAWGLLRRVPPEYLPWAPLEIEAPLTFATPIKQARLGDDGAACRTALGTGRLAFQAAASQAGSCPLTDPVRLSALGARLLMSCPLAVAFALYERHALQPAALAAFGQPVVRLHHLGTFACRNIGGRAEARRSEHAAANAIDIAGFELADGRRIALARDWGGTGPPAAFLRAARDGACRFFGAVLGPDYNTAHRDHFHLDMGRWRVCR